MCKKNHNAPQILRELHVIFTRAYQVTELWYLKFQQRKLTPKYYQLQMSPYFRMRWWQNQRNSLFGRALWFSLTATYQIHSLPLVNHTSAHHIFQEINFVFTLPADIFMKTHLFFFVFLIYSFRYSICLDMKNIIFHLQGQIIEHLPTFRQVCHTVHIKWSSFWGHQIQRGKLSY